MNGLLIVDKPAAMTSHDVIAQLRRATGEKSLGHLGTLDPLATGVLPVLAGKYTRLAQYFGRLTKTYTGTIRFGFATDTFDSQGKATSPAKEISLSYEAVRTAAAQFHGEILQTPPPFSAKKVAGVPAYKAARRGEAVPLQPVRIVVEEFQICALRGSEADFEIRISAGGYVRSIAHDLGAQLDCGGHLSALRRISAGPFTLDQACTLEGLCAARGAMEKMLLHPRMLLPELPAATADLWTAGRLRNGMQVNLPEFSNAPLVRVFEGQRELIAIGKRVAGTLFQPVTVLA